MKGENKTWTVYTFTTPDGMVYVGMSNNPKSRCRPRKYVGNIREEIERWGWKQLEHRLLCTFTDKVSAHRFEDSMIMFCRTNSISLNITRSGTRLNDDGGERDYNEYRRMYRHDDKTRKMDRDRQRQYRAEHKEQYRLRSKVYYNSHRDEINCKRRARRAAKRIQNDAHNS